MRRRGGRPLGGRTQLSARAGAPTPLLQGAGHARWPRANAGEGTSTSVQARNDVAQVALRLGELLHVAQPVLHLLLVQLMPARWRNTRRAWLPWATAFLVDVAALQLCAAATRAPERHEGLGDALRALLRLRAASYSAENFDELRHRRELAMLFLVRPASLATLRSLLRVALLSRTAEPGALAQLLEQLLERERTSAHMFR